MSSPTTRSRVNTASGSLLAAALLSGVVLLTSCSGLGAAKVPSCAEYAAMASDTGLMSSLTKEQESAIGNILTKHKKKNNATNDCLLYTSRCV